MIRTWRIWELKSPMREPGKVQEEEIVNRRHDRRLGFVRGSRKQLLLNRKQRSPLSMEPLLRAVISGLQGMPGHP